MGFFKPPSSQVSSKSVARVHALIWILIYAGLLTLVLGLSVARVDHAFGWPLVGGGALVAVIGVLLIYVRSKMKLES